MFLCFCGLVVSSSAFHLEKQCERQQFAVGKQKHEFENAMCKWFGLCHCFATQTRTLSDTNIIQLMRAWNGLCDMIRFDVAFWVNRYYVCHSWWHEFFWQTK